MRYTRMGARNGLRGMAVSVGAALILLLSLLVADPVAAAPSAPTPLSPAEGETVQTDSPTLRVAADSGLDVRFEGRRADATAAGPGAGEPFTLVALPDIQNYTSRSRAATIAAQTQWVVDTRATRNTQFVVQLGDLVSSLDWAGHWPYASAGLKVLNDNGVPNAVVAGNHDFHTDTGTHAEYDEWFPPSRFADATWTPSTAEYGGYMGQDQFGDDPVDRGNMNNFSLFSAGGVDWLVLGLEWEAPTASLDWADRVLAAHPDRQVVMFTHAFLTESATRRAVAQRPGGTAPEAIWESFVRSHCQIRLILNGHESGSQQSEAHRTDRNDCGGDVHQILSNYQTRPNGGDGWLRAYRFDPSTATLTAETYSPTLDAHETDANSAFTLPFAFSEPQDAPFETIGTVTASGGSAEIVWTDLDDDVEYEWRAVASDGIDEAASVTRTFTTSAPAPAPTALVDEFGRSVASGWGDADPEHSWATSSSSTFSVDGTAGRIVITPSAQRTATVTGWDAADASTVMSFVVTPSPSGSGTYAALLARYSSAGDYRAKVVMRASGSASLYIVRRSGSTETTLATATVPGGLSAGQRIQVRLETEGASSVALRARLWTGAQEPSGWTATATDGSVGHPLTGTVGVWAYTSGTSAQATNIAVERIESLPLGATPPPPANLPPTAVIALTSQDGRHVEVSGTGSSDSDGTVADWSWTFGDGGTATGSTASHDYTADGTYTVSLTVTDDDGSSRIATRSLTITAEAPSDELVSDTFTRSVSNGWGRADVGGAWSALAAASAQSVADGVARHTLTGPGKSTTSALGAALDEAAVELRVALSFSRTGAQGTMYAAVSAGSVTNASDYRLKIQVGSSNRPRLDLVRRVDGAETVLASTTLSTIQISGGAQYSVVLRTAGTGTTTTLSAKLYVSGAAEPAAWSVTATDSTASLQQPGRVLVWSYVSGSSTAPLTVSYDDVTVRPF